MVSVRQLAFTLSPLPLQDCKGVFPSHPWLNSADGQTALKRVLSAYSIHNDKVMIRMAGGSAPRAIPIISEDLQQTWNCILIERVMRADS